MLPTPTGRIPVFTAHRRLGPLDVGTGTLGKTLHRLAGQSLGLLPPARPPQCLCSTHEARCVVGKGTAHVLPVRERGVPVPAAHHRLALVILDFDLRALGLPGEHSGGEHDVLQVAGSRAEKGTDGEVLLAPHIEGRSGSCGALPIEHVGDDLQVVAGDHEAGVELLFDATEMIALVEAAQLEERGAPDRETRASEGAVFVEAGREVSSEGQGSPRVAGIAGARSSARQETMKAGKGRGRRLRRRPAKHIHEMGLAVVTSGVQKDEEIAARLTGRRIERGTDAAMRLVEDLAGARPELFLEGRESFEGLLRLSTVTHYDDLVHLALLKEQRFHQRFQELGLPVMIDAGRDPCFRPGTVHPGGPKRRVPAGGFRSRRRQPRGCFELVPAADVGHDHRRRFFREHPGQVTVKDSPDGEVLLVVECPLRHRTSFEKYLLQGGSERLRMRLDEHPIMVALRDQLGRPADGRRKEGDPVHETLVDGHGRVLDDRGHHRYPWRSTQIADRLVLVVGVDDLHRKGPGSRLLSDELDGRHPGVRGQPLALLAEEGDLMGLHSLLDDARDGVAEDVEPLSCLEAPEEHQLPSLDPIAVPVSGSLLFDLQVLQIDDVRLNEGAAGRETVAFVRHEGEQVGAAADDDIGALHDAPFRIHAGELRPVTEGQHAVVPIPDPGRRGLHHEQCALERESESPGEQGVVDSSPPLGRMDDIVGWLVLQPVVELVHLPLPPRRRANQLGRHCRQGNEADGEAPIEFDPVLYGLVLALHALEIEHGDRVAVAGQGPREMIVGRGNAAVAHRAEDLLGCDADPEASPGESVAIGSR